MRQSFFCVLWLFGVKNEVNQGNGKSLCYNREQQVEVDEQPGMAKKRKQNQPPRRKRMKRPQRLESAKSWLETYEGNKVVRDYRRRYGVDFETAFTELALLGIPIDPDYG